MKEFNNLSCDIGDAFAKFFYWPNEIAKYYIMVWSVEYELCSFNPLAMAQYIKYFIWIQVTNGLWQLISRNILLVAFNSSRFYNDYSRCKDTIPSVVILVLYFNFFNH